MSLYCLNLILNIKDSNTAKEIIKRSVLIFPVFGKAFTEVVVSLFVLLLEEVFIFSSAFVAELFVGIAFSISFELIYFIVLYY